MIAPVKLPFSRWFGRFALVVVPAVLIVVACVTVIVFERRAQEHHTSAQRVGDIELLAAQVSAQEWKAIAEGEVSEADSRQVELLLAAMVADLEAVARADRRDAAVASAALDEYTAAVRDEFAFLRDGDLENAEEVDEERVDPSFEALEGVVRRIVQEEEAAAIATDEQALVGSLLVIVLTSAALIAVTLTTLRARGRAEMARFEEATVRASEQRLGALLRNSSDVLLVLDRDGNLQYASESVDRLLDRHPDSLVGHDLRDLLDAQSHEAFGTQMRRAAARPGTPIAEEWALRTADGGLRFVEAILNDLCADPRINGFVANLRDVTERRRLEDELRRRAYHDELTGLANRARFEDRILEALTNADRSGSSPAIVFLDLDDFKHVNDSLGHACGDELLRVVANRLQDCVRAQDTVARLGGDEFAILLPSIDSAADVVEIADRVLAALSKPLMVHSNALLVNASLGVAFDPAPGEDRPGRLEALLRDADIAMYAAKGAGKNRLEIFESELHAPIVGRLQLKTEMQAALSGDEFVLHFQPIVVLGSEEIIGAEALVRWEHPVRGLIPPLEFIPLAEQTGLIVPLGHWVLREALRQAALWRAEAPNGDLRYVSVNVTGHQLESPTFLDEVRDALRDAGLPPEALVIEVTESALIHDTERNTTRLQALRDLGVRLAIDDFGTGYSALNYLRRFPMDVLKIDRSFIETVAGTSQEAALVEAMIQMSGSLGLRVIAEGIEQTGQCERLQELECGYGQGFLFSRPVPADQLLSLMAGTRCAATV